MMRGIFTTAAALSLLALGCSSSTSDPPLTAPTFGRNEQKIWAIPSRLEIDSPMVIVTRCLPLVDGKGRLALDGRTSLNGIHWHVLEPMDTVMTQLPPADLANILIIPVTFHANQPLEIHWRIQFSAFRSHGFNANFFIDSIYLADGPGMVGINSSEAIAHSLRGQGYQYGEFAYPNLTLDP